MRGEIAKIGRAQARIEVAGEAVAQRGRRARPLKVQVGAAAVVDGGRAAVRVLEAEHRLRGRQRREAVQLDDVGRLHVLQVGVRLNRQPKDLSPSGNPEPLAAVAQSDNPQHSCFLHSIAACRQARSACMIMCIMPTRLSATVEKGAFMSSQAGTGGAACWVCRGRQASAPSRRSRAWRW